MAKGHFRFRGSFIKNNFHIWTWNNLIKPLNGLDFFAVISAIYHFTKWVHLLSGFLLKKVIKCMINICNIAFENEAIKLVPVKALLRRKCKLAR